jgi:preprotein translocase subunit SecG
MNFHDLLIGLMTFIMVLDCLILVLLVLIQLPKKEAGAGLAFGGGATDALFGAGSGNVLTKITKYAAGIFFGLALLIGILQKSGTGTSQFEKDLLKPGRTPAALPSPTPGPTAANPAAPGASNATILEEPTNAPTRIPAFPTAPVTNAAPQAPGSNAPPK